MPILEKLLSSHVGQKKQHPRSLIIAPTRELADQINQSIQQLGTKTNLKSTTIYGGVNKNPQNEVLSKGVDIVIACPGRLLDHIREKTITLSKIEMLVIDEADTMFDMGFLPDIRSILSHLPVERQTMFFAATMPPPIKTLASEILDSPKSVQIGIIAPAKTVKHALYPTTDKMKKRMIMHLLKQTATGQVMIFTRTKRRARFLASDLENDGFKVAPLQGNMSQNKRQQAISGFRKGKYDILVATDIASRGIDVSDVTHVINYDMPNTVDTYIHRIGRTGRAENIGEAFTFSTREDEPLIRKVEKILGSEIERRTIEDFDYGGFTPKQDHHNPSRGQRQERQHRNGSNPNSNRNNKSGRSWGKSKFRGTRNKRSYRDRTENKR